MERSEKLMISYFRLSEEERGRASFGGSAAELLRKGCFAVGYAHTAILNDDGTVTAHGDNSCGQCDTEGWTGVVKVAAGDWHTVGLKKNGTVVAAGDNSSGQCDTAAWKNIKQLYAEKGLTVGVTADGRLILSEKRIKKSSVHTDTKKAGSTEPPTPSSEFLFHISPVDEGIVIDKYKGNRPVVRIPAYVNGRPVTEIGNKAFFKNNTLRTVYIPDSVKLLGSKAFGACTSLMIIHISDRTKARLHDYWYNAFEGMYHENRYSEITFAAL